MTQETTSVRAYAVTVGRTRPAVPLESGSLVRTAASPPYEAVSPEGLAAVRLCAGQALSVAELATLLQLPLQVAKVVVADLLHGGFLIHAMPDRSADGSDPSLLEAVLDGLRNL
ncbi:DUF742 domain-containing protein [Streptomyces sp. NPDC002644]